MSAARVRETFFSLDVQDMPRATAFYVDAFAAEVAYASARWSSLIIAGVRIGLAASPHHGGAEVGLHFAVDDLSRALEVIESAGGAVVSSPREVAARVWIARCDDTEGNTFTLTQNASAQGAQ